MIILVDSNEQAMAPKTVEQLTAQFKNVMVTKLQSGDVNIINEEGKTFMVERKTVNDLLASIADGRLFEQVERMSTANWSAIVVTGHLTYNEYDMAIADGSETNWRGISVRNAIAACEWSGCPVIFTSVANYGNTVRELFEFIQKPAAHTQFRKNRYITFPPIEQSVEILAQFPGIGVKRAETMMLFVGVNGEYGTLAGALEWLTLCRAMPDNRRPEGWGNKILATVCGALGLNSDEYIVIKKEAANGDTQESAAEARAETSTEAV